jgi:hypothetical protein
MKESLEYYTKYLKEFDDDSEQYKRKEEYLRDRYLNSLTKVKMVVSTTA